MSAPNNPPVSLHLGDRFINWALRTDRRTLVICFVAAYLGGALLFALLYRFLVPGDIRPSPGTFQDYLLFSFATQATAGYGDYYAVGIAGWLATFQGFLGVTLIPSLVALVVFRLLRPHDRIRFPKSCCYDPQKDTFVFRFLNDEGGDGLIGASVRVHLHRSPPPTEDGLITRQAYRLALQEETEGALIPSPWLSAYRSLPPEDKCQPAGDLHPRDNRLLVAHLREGDFFTLGVSGTLAASGTQVLPWCKYGLQLIQCGLFVEADNDFSKLNDVKPTTEEYCRTCRWLSHGCALGLAKRVRATAVSHG